MTCNETQNSWNISLNVNSCVGNNSVRLQKEWVAPGFDINAKNVILAVFLTAIDVVTIFGNLLVLLSFVIERRLLQPFNLFILNLAVTDFLVAITAMTFYTLDTLLGYWPFGYVMCGVWIYFDFAMTFASVFTLVAISVDRFWCVTWALHYRIHNSRTKTAIILAVIWFCVVAIWTAPFINDRLTYSDVHVCIWEPSNNTQFVIIVAVIGHYIPCAVMVFCYFKVFYVMKRQASLVAAHVQSTSRTRNTPITIAVQQANTSAGSNQTDNTNIADNNHLNIKAPENKTKPSQNCNSSASRSSMQCSTASAVLDTNGQYRGITSSNASRDKKIFITLTYVLSSYLICWFPFYIAFDTYAWKPELVPANLYTVLFWMTYVNSTINPFIYAYTSKEFRLAFKKVLNRLYRCKVQA